MWECVCDCGVVKPIAQRYLLNHTTISCGCYGKEKLLASHTTHNLTHSGFYQMWKNMMRRCYEPTVRGYERYGGRGISVCEEWHDINNFVEWCVKQNPPKGFELDRINNDGNYEPGNCRFVSRTDNIRNRSTVLLITINNETHPLAEWCERFDIDYRLVFHRIRKLNWTPEKALTTPIVSPAKHMITYQNKTQDLAKWCRELNVSYNMVFQRIVNGGWDPVEALVTPPKK